ncbi:regulator of chromosome condensation-like isoform X1 [Ruditapes philippinarum]|uniref:regulator of chromosome condensation-like isoform X1 n=2 Tax=Ruditapes philippinarum TaxID=129788 RepID=UPI00295AC7AB|nr:regulator of chromosome condensation-like isoform X1 [Ruditapes philippinarum]
MPPLGSDGKADTLGTNIGDLFKGSAKPKMAGKGKKRSRESEDNQTKKRQRVHHPCHGSVGGVVLVCGEGDVGQLGLGVDVIGRKRPALVTIEDPVIQVCGGGMHTVCLTEKGEVYTFGCNDEGTLGRDTSEEGSETVPGKVDGLPKIVYVCAGDSHTAALSEDGRVFAWGNFRDASGSMGFTTNGIQNTPMHLLEGETIVKITSGGDHLVCLSDVGEIFTCGCAEQGQLGRVAECFSQRGGRKGLASILTPEIVRFRKKKSVFCDIWAGQYITFAKEKNTGEIYSWGLNNYFQLGFSEMTNRFVPEKVKSFDKKNWTCLEGGQHHTIALDDKGNVYSLGRADYGRLGLGEHSGEVKEPTLVKLEKKCTSISAGQSVSFALLEDGTVASWGMGTSSQLGNGEEDDSWVPSKMDGKQLQERKVIQVSAGGQHTVLLAVDK